MTGHPAIWYVSGLASGYVIGVACCAVLLCIVLRRGLRPCDAVDRALAAERRDHSIAIAMLKSEGVAARAKDAEAHAAALAAKDAEIGSYKHEHALLEADTMRGITDCSTPIFQRVRNIVEQLEAAESERDTLRAQRQQVTTERNAADARLAEVEAERDESEAQVESLRAQLDQQAQRYNAALDRLIADKDQLSLAGSHLRAQLAAVQSATPEAVTRELERGHYSIIRAWLALHGGTSAQIAVEEMAQLVRSFGEPLTLKEPTGYSRSEFERDRMGEVFGAARAEGAEGMKLSQKRRNAVYAAIHRTLTDLRIDLKLALSQDVRVAQSEIALMKAVEQALEGGARHE